MNNQAKVETIRAFMERHNMTRDDFSEALGVSRHTVDSWLKKDTNRSWRPIPDWAIKSVENMEAAARNAGA